ERALSLASGLSQELRGLVAGIDDPLRLVYLLSSLIDMKADEKQQILEHTDLAAKLQAVAAAMNREIALLEMKSKSESAAQHQMIRTYIDWVLDVPWSTTTEDRLDPVAARTVLDEDHYDLDKVKDRIVEYLAVQKLKTQNSPTAQIKGPILCFVGPHGVGKTS